VKSWTKFSAEDEGCTAENCIKRGGICPFYRARLAAQSAHILVVNHALLLADVATGNKVLPEYDYLIVDEAHHMEDATTNALSFKVTRPAIERTIRELGNQTSGIFGWIYSTVESILPPDTFAEINFLIQRGTDLAFHFDTYVQGFFQSLEQFLMDQREGRQVGMYAHQERILPAPHSACLG
jgi:DNA polymerase-3 subunit epsilon/ATP-dependent DNA helicase DinG